MFAYAVWFNQGKKKKKKKSLFWVPAVAPLTSVVLSTLRVYITHADRHGVKTVSGDLFED